MFDSLVEEIMHFYGKSLSLGATTKSDTNQPNVAETLRGTIGYPDAVRWQHF